MKVLLAIDSSPSSKILMDEVKARHWSEGTTVCVFNAVDTTTGAMVWIDLGPFVKSETEAAQKMVEETAGRLAKGGFRVTTEVKCGYPSEEIIDYSNEWEADLVVLGSHGHNAVSRFLMGSVAKAVLRGASCSVEIVRPRPRGNGPAMQVLLAVDGSDCSIAATRSVAARPWPEGSEIKVIRAVEAAIPTIEPWYAGSEAVEEIRELSAKQAEEDVKAATKVITDAGLKATSSVIVGYPKAVIVDAADDWGADLIVVGSHGRHGLTRLLMGSVSEAVALHAHCSVEVVRERAKA